MFKVKIVKTNANYSVKAHDVQIRRKTNRYGPKGTFMVNPGYFVSRRDTNSGRFVKA